MNYQEALAYLYSFSDFERSGTYSRDREDNLSRENRLLARLGNPQQQYSSTLIAGTKGKGSTAALIESVLRQAGLRTGLYTQPDLHTYRERMRVNGTLIGEKEMGDLVPEVAVAVDELQREGVGPFITYEVGTALAFLYFQRKQVQHAVVEVGIGGRLDATNVLAPLVSVITSISYDHMQILGNTLTEIAGEKAGIIKVNGSVVSSAQEPEALLAIARVCRQRQARLIRIAPEGDDPAQSQVDGGELPAPEYRYRVEQQSRGRQRFRIRTPQRSYTQLEIPLLGLHQLENAAAALASLDVLRERGLAWDEEALRRGFGLVNWPARMQIVGQEPLIIVDGAHNADSMEKLIKALRATFPEKRQVIVLGVAQDKDIKGILRALAESQGIVLTQARSPRAFRSAELAKIAVEQVPRLPLYQAASTDDALDLAMQLVNKDDLICATGSLYLAAEALQWAAKHGDKKAASQIEGRDH